VAEDSKVPASTLDGDPRDYPDSLCHDCAGCRYVPARASTFILCTTLDVKYPRQPVRSCAGFRARADD
jgi:hypothetical protein